MTVYICFMEGGQLFSQMANTCISSKHSNEMSTMIQFDSVSGIQIPQIQLNQRLQQL